MLASQCEGVSVVACGPSTGPCPASRRPISQGYLVHDTTAAAGVTDDGDPGDSLLYLSRIWRDVVTSIVSFTAVPTDTGDGVTV